MSSVEIRACAVDELNPTIRQVVKDQLLEGEEALFCCERALDGKHCSALVVTKSEIIKLSYGSYDNFYFSSMYVKDVGSIKEDIRSDRVVIRGAGGEIDFDFESKEHTRWFVYQLRLAIKNAKSGQS